ncbi:hypothetical protein [Streptomyces sp. A0958]|uniref:hypothetical protein n=1 Tax=Streptomyces sp. A0958 TaxID=2563101 RepID=UPI001F0E9091|nr:hypothetical protein [Streptomyces sp. A0958]
MFTSTPRGWEIARTSVSTSCPAEIIGPAASAPPGRSSQNGVSTRPGAIRVVPTPYPVVSMRTFSARPVTANFVIE